MVDVPYDVLVGIPPAEVGEVDLYHPRSWWTRYVFSQDAKVISFKRGGRRLVPGYRASAPRFHRQRRTDGARAVSARPKKVEQDQLRQLLRPGSGGDGRDRASFSRKAPKRLPLERYDLNSGYLTALRRNTTRFVVRQFEGE